jgi:hypothetical protein
MWVIPDYSYMEKILIDVINNANYQTSFTQLKLPLDTFKIPSAILNSFSITPFIRDTFTSIFVIAKETKELL